VTSTATVVATASTGVNQTIRIHVDVNSPIVYLGSNSGVTSSTGLAVGGGSNVVIERAGMAPSTALTIYGLVASGSASGRLQVSSTTA
jgi:hypothetical protein